MACRCFYLALLQAAILTSGLAFSAVAPLKQPKAPCMWLTQVEPGDENGLAYPLADMRMRPKSAGLQSYVGMLYGENLRRAGGNTRPHQGWDLFAKVGTPVRSLGNGRVIHVEHGHPDYGTQLIISFNFRSEEFFAQYAHLSEVDVRTDECVSLGQKIGSTGVSGNGDTRYPHLHFEIRTTSKLQAGTGLQNRRDPAEIFPRMYKSYEDFAKRRTGTVD